MDTLNLLSDYFLRTLPSLIIGLAFILLLGKQHLIIRIFSYILLFIVMRDVMTPLNIWDFGTEGIFWLRTVDNPVFLLLISGLSIILIVVVNKLDKEASEVYVFRKMSYIKAIGTGLIGAAIILVPMFLIYQFVPMEQRGGTVNNSSVFLLSLLVFCVSVNFLEESIYRGYFQGYIEQFFSPAKSAVLSGLLFSFSHIFLATTVTNAGWGVLAFTAFEGIIAGLIRSKAGVLASTITHGVAIFFLCSGLF
ncbi:MAG: CPBP family intramembrane metalloprotease [Sphingobacteriales bacterium]|nr:MAG: CPBP family intramembrane metalloprotease [Sphingobacteriales bacterium]